MSQKFLDSLLRKPFDTAVAEIDELVTEYGQVYGLVPNENFRAFLVDEIIKRVQVVK